MPLFVDKQTYSRTGTLLSRLIGFERFFIEHPVIRQHILVFEGEKERRDAGKIIGSLNIRETPIIHIDSVQDILRYRGCQPGIYITSPAAFDVSLRLEYLYTKLSVTLSLGNPIAPKELTEQLLNLGYTYSPSLGKPHSYYFSGSEYLVRDESIEYRLSYFGDEIDDLLRVESGIEPKIVRCTEITLYQATPEPLPETLKKVSESKYTGMIWTFDLDFLPERANIRSLFKHSIAFEGGGENIDCSIPIIEGVDELTQVLRDAGEKATIWTELGTTINSYLTNNGLKTKVRVLPKNSMSLSFQTVNELVIADDLLKQIFVQKRSRKHTLATLDLLLTLHPGDYIVHKDHGIGQFREIVCKEVGTHEREYLALDYAKGDALFVPITELHRITKYLGEATPVLHTLGGTIWKKVMKDTEDDVLKTATELLDLYARRKITRGFAFEDYNNLEDTFRTSFKYTHTKDQLTAISEIFADMASETPMDRLLAGDVGFGKTEVAMNATYKAILSGKQVAVISPLVVLTLEHVESFRDRFAHLDICIECLSRLSSTKEERNILAGLADGTIDIVIATHRILGEDVYFKGLGLLVIDEEHRFGVKDKERIKTLRQEIDILSLSATPIPRSLNMALSGMRTLSVLRDPPPSRKAIHTQILGWNAGIITEAIIRELERDGQVLFLHNRVMSLEGTAQELVRMCGPKLKPILLHGQMLGHEIEDALIAFREGRGNCLVSTTVIENGVNFLRANTIIIDHADEFGLAQLHQLRGRVGRSDKAAYAILLYRKPFLADDAKKRLLAIAEHSELGAGFEIALRDLEIRGAGEILGVSQSGKTKQTGMSLYFKLLESKIEELKSGTKKSSLLDIGIELDLGLVLEDSLFTSDMDKLNFYRNIESIETLEELDEFEQGWEDTKSLGLGTLILLVRARIYLSRHHVKSVKRVMGDYVLNFEGATTQTIRAFLETDKNADFVVQSLERVKVRKGLYISDLDFLQKLVYSLSYDEI